MDIIGPGRSFPVRHYRLSRSTLLPSLRESLTHHPRAARFRTRNRYYSPTLYLLVLFAILCTLISRLQVGQGLL
jgi:hypothetical protein